MTKETLKKAVEIDIQITELNQFISSIGSPFSVADHGCGKSRSINAFVRKILVEEKANVRKKAENKLVQLEKEFAKL